MGRTRNTFRGEIVMNTSVFSNGLRRLFGFSAIVVVALSMLVLSGCGHKCGCRQNSGCSTCSTCGVSDNAPPPACATCSACQANANNVGAAPASLSEPLSIQTQTQPSNTYAVQPSTYTPAPTNTSNSRPGDSLDLPTFSSKPAPAYRASEIPEPVFSPAPVSKQPAAQILNTPSAGQTHTLQKGETIYALSRQYGVKPKAILEANHFSDPNHLSVGTKVIIPAN